MSWRAFVKTFCLILLGLIGLAAVTAAVLLLTGTVNPYALARRVAAGRDQNLGETFAVTGEGTEAAAAPGEGLLLVTEGSLRIYDGGGALKDHRDGVFTGALLHESGDWAAVYLPQGRRLWVYGPEGFAYEAEVEGEILAASVNSRGWLAVSWVEQRYQGAVSVFSDRGTPSYRLHAAEGYPVAAQVAPGGYDLAVLRLHAGGSRLELYDMRREAVRASLELEGEIPAELAWFDEDRLLTCGLRCLRLFDADLNRLGIMELEDRSLRSVRVTPRFALLELGAGPDRGELQLVSLDRNLRVLGDLSPADPLRSLSVRGNYLALLTGEGTEILDRTLKSCALYPVRTLQGRVLMRPNGTVLLLDGDKARILG